ncbi:MAG: PAS domain-containing protein [Crocinitomicaceae bacterium]
MKKGTHTSGKNISEMMSLDLYLNSLPEDQYQKISKSLISNKRANTPLISWEYFMMSYSKNIEQIQRSNDVEAIQSLQMKHQWQEDLPTLLDADFDAIVLTNADLVIEWVNPGFTDMTGYSSGFAIGKTPLFLQGEKTSMETRKHIRESIKMERSFKASVVNYRKDQLEYDCEIQVFPLRSENGELSHFLALETELRA